MAALIGSAVQLASPAAQALSVARMIRSRAPPAPTRENTLAKL